MVEINHEQFTGSYLFVLIFFFQNSSCTSYYLYGSTNDTYHTEKLVRKTLFLEVAWIIQVVTVMAVNTESTVVAR
jgi:Na+/alanine symporter